MSDAADFIPAGAAFVALDVETAGLWPAAARTVETAAVRFRLDSDGRSAAAPLDRLRTPPS